MLSLANLIRERRSVHQFEDRVVPVELVKDILDTAVWVPNHKMTQPWRFVLVHGQGKEKLADAARRAAPNAPKFANLEPEKRAEMGQKMYQKFMGVPLFLAVVMSEAPHAHVREEDYASTSIIIHNFSLLAWEQGIGLVWETYGLIQLPEFREALGVKPDEKIVGMLHMGYPAKVPEAQSRIPAVERLTIIE